MNSNPRLIKYFLFNTKRYFVDAERYIELSNTFSEVSWWTLMDMWFPLVSAIHCVVTKSLPDLFFLLGLYKSLKLWAQWHEYHALKYQLGEWREIVNAVGGPYIATNNPLYLPYVFADGMQRLQNLHIRRHVGVPGLTVPSRPPADPPVTTTTVVR